MAQKGIARLRDPVHGSKIKINAGFSAPLAG